MTAAQQALPEAIAAICVPQDTAIEQALAQLDQTGRRILLVTNSQRMLLGVVTDSNFRRAMLARTSWDRPVGEIMTTRPIVVPETMGDDDVLKLMERTHCHEIPVIDREGRVVALRQIEEILSHREHRAPRIAVVMAGGLGQRLRPLTDTHPKPMLMVGDKPILFTILDRLLAAGIDRIYLTLNYKAEVIREAVSQVWRYRDIVRFIEESKRLGTAGALTLLPEIPQEPFLITNGDLLTAIPFADMLRFHHMEGNAMTVALREEVFSLPYGIARLEGTRITAMEEKPNLRHFINAGVYVLEPSVLRHIPPDTYHDATTLVNDLLNTGQRVGSFPVHEYWIDIGQPHQLEQARRDYHTIFDGKKASD